jgi:hypothetical protein
MRKPLRNSSGLRLAVVRSRKVRAASRHLKRQGDLQNAPGDDHISEGLLRPRKGPHDKAVGREEAQKRRGPSRIAIMPRTKTGEFYLMASTIKVAPKKQSDEEVQQS